MKRIAFDVHGREFLVGDFDAGRVVSVVKLRLDAKAGGCGRVAVDGSPNLRIVGE
jgi:hypothetical protein